MPRAPQPPKTTRKLEAYQYIKAKILACDYAPGEALNEALLCAEMGGISRTPVRDALGRLESEGLVQIRPKKGVLVAGITLEDVDRIYEARMLIEPYTLSAYGGRLPREELERWLALLQSDSPTAHPESYYSSLDDDFHDFLLSALPNRYLFAAYSNLKALNTRIRVLSDRAARPRVVDTYAEHIAILQALLANDPAAAAAAMRRHLELGRQTAMRFIALQEPPAP